MVRLAAEPLSAEAFAPFGRVVQRPSRPHDAAGPGWRWWAETAGLAGDGRPWGIGYLDLEPAPLRFDWAERHLRTLEAILPTARDILVYVGPAEHPDAPDRHAESFEHRRPSHDSRTLPPTALRSSSSLSR